MTTETEGTGPRQKLKALRLLARRYRHELRRINDGQVRLHDAATYEDLLAGVRTEMHAINAELTRIKGEECVTCD